MIQRIAYQGNQNYRITKEQIDLLESIGMVFEGIFEKRWMERYNLAKAYYEHYGNLDIPQKFRTKNGYEYDEAGTALGAWIAKQRSAYQENPNCKITEGRIALLESIGMTWSIKNNRSEEVIEKPKTYKLVHGKK